MEQILMIHGLEVLYFSDFNQMVSRIFTKKDVGVQMEAAETADNAHKYLFHCVSQPDSSVVSERSGPSLNRRGCGGHQVRGTLSSSDPLFFLGLKTH